MPSGTPIIFQTSPWQLNLLHSFLSNSALTVDFLSNADYLFASAVMCPGIKVGREKYSMQDACGVFPLG